MQDEAPGGGKESQDSGQSRHLHCPHTVASSVQDRLLKGRPLGTEGIE
jgi:hypothetical protein